MNKFINTLVRLAYSRGVYSLNPKEAAVLHQSVTKALKPTDLAIERACSEIQLRFDQKERTIIEIFIIIYMSFK